MTILPCLVREEKIQHRKEVRSMSDLKQQLEVAGLVGTFGQPLSAGDLEAFCEGDTCKNGCTPGCEPGCSPGCKPGCKDGGQPGC